MAEQIIISQGDSGIEIATTFVNKKIPVDITGCTVDIAFVYPSGEVRHTNGQIVNAAQGKASYVLADIDTEETGLVATYWKVIDDNSEVTAQEEIYYYVREYLGGAVIEENN